MTPDTIGPPHPSHQIELGDSHYFCERCGAVDKPGAWGELGNPCRGEPNAEETKS